MTDNRHQVVPESVLDNVLKSPKYSYLTDMSDDELRALRQGHGNTSTYYVLPTHILYRRAQHNRTEKT